MPRILPLLVPALLVGVLAAQQTLVIPAGFANAEAASSNAFPWGRTGIGLRHQCIYDSSHFTSQGVLGPVTITQLRWRPNTGVALTASSYTAGCTVYLSTSPVDQASVTSVFASNRGADYMQVFSGPVSWNAQAAQTGPCPFGITIPLTQPFTYNPTLGDLNIECDLPVQTFTGSGPQLDVESGLTTSLASRVYMSTGYPTGTVTVNTNHAVVVEVTYMPSTGYAYAASYGTGCISQPDASTYELFATAPAFDLANSTMSLFRSGSGYIALGGVATYVPPTPAATSLALSDDSDVSVPLSAPFPIGVSGSTNSLTVCSNGYVSSGPGNGTGYQPTAAAFLSGTAACWSLGWHDFNPTILGSGQVKFEEIGGVAYVTWDGVWDYSGTSTANACTMQLQFDLTTGTVHYVWQTMSTLGIGFLVGVSDAGISTDPGSMDISATLPQTFNACTFAITPLAHTAGARPVIGTTVPLVTSNFPAGTVLGLDLLGVTQINPGFDLTALGMPGCYAYTTIDASVAFAPVGNVGTVSLPVPSNPALAGAIVLSQGAALAPGINAFGFTTSNGVKLLIDVN